MPMKNSIHYSDVVYNYFKRLRLGLFFSNIYIRHLGWMLI